MFQKKVQTLFTAIVAAMLLAAPLSADHKIEEASLLLQKIESKALTARHHAARLKSFTAFPGLHSWEAHTFELTQVRTAANDIAELAGDFKGLKDHASQRQNKAFNHVVTEAAKLADATEKSIKIVNTEKEKLEVAHPTYEKAVEEIYKRTDRIVAAVGLAESWEEVQEAKEKLSTSD